MSLIPGSNHPFQKPRPGSIPQRPTNGLEQKYFSEKGEPFSAANVKPYESQLERRKSLVATAETGKESFLIRLVLAAQRGDRKSLGELHQYFQVAIYATIRRQHLNESDVEEIGQEVSLQASRSLRSLHNPQCIGSWLRTIASRLAVQRVTKHAGPILIDPHISLANPISTVGSPLDHLIERERYEAVHAALDSLSRPHRRILRHFYFHHYSLVQISEIEGLPLGTVKSRLHAARNKLADLLRHLKTA